VMMSSPSPTNGAQDLHENLLCIGDASVIKSKWTDRWSELQLTVPWWMGGYNTCIRILVPPPSLIACIQFLMPPNHGCLIRTVPYGINKRYIPTVIHTLAHQQRGHDWLVCTGDALLSDTYSRAHIWRYRETQYHINKQCQNIVVQLWLVFEYSSMNCVTVQ